MGSAVRALVIAAILLAPSLGRAAPKAAVVMDARTGQVLLAENADTPLHPASLTKMLTLYVVFAAIERGEIGPDAMVAVSARAAGTGGSSIGLTEGQSMSVRHLIRATAVRSANDAAVALAETVGADEAGFVARMNATARAMGLQRTTFANPHGLTAADHLTTARDMSVLGRRLMLDFPGYAGLYSRLGADVGRHRVAHTNRRFLSGYPGANGLKTGYTRAAGFTLTASAVRGDKHIIVTVLGASSSAERAAWAARLLDWGFAQVPEHVAPVPPAPLAPPHGPRDLVPEFMATVRPLLAPGAPPPPAPSALGGLGLSALIGVVPAGTRAPAGGRDAREGG